MCVVSARRSLHSAHTLATQRTNQYFRSASPRVRVRVRVSVCARPTLIAAKLSVRAPSSGASAGACMCWRDRN